MRRFMHVLAWGLIGLVLAAGLTVGGYRIGREERTVEAAAVAPQTTRAPSNQGSVRPFTVASTPAPSPAGDPSPNVIDSASDAPASLDESPAAASPASSVVPGGESDLTCRDDDDRSDSDNSGPGSGDDRSDSDSSGPGSDDDDSNSGSGSDSSGSGSSGSDSSGSGSDGSGSSNCD